MTPMKLDVTIALFCYGGNGGIASILPEIAVWLTKLQQELESDERVGRVGVCRYGDVPLTMERNRAVRDAKAGGFDVLLMLDSDNVPDLYLGHLAWAKPFWKSSFDFIYARKMKGLPTVVFAPYCGPPPHPVTGGEENVYVFRAQNFESDGPNHFFKFEGYDRKTAAQMRGLQQAAAGPTGVILYTLDSFDLLPIGEMSQAQILDGYRDGTISIDRAIRLLGMQSYFWYEFTDRWQTHKASTEDVTNTREIQMAGITKFGEPVLFCNWDAWAGHMKPRCVGMPMPLAMENVSEVYKEAVLSGLSHADELRSVSFPKPNVTPIEEPEPVPQTIGGIGTGRRNLFGFDVQTLGFQTSEEDLTMLGRMVSGLRREITDRELLICEVGSWVGESALAMHAASPRATIYCVDTWLGSPRDSTRQAVEAVGQDRVREIFRRNVDAAGGQIRSYCGESLEAAENLLPGTQFDLVYIDAGHTFQEVMVDIEAWAPRVADGGLLCGHDYSDQFPGVGEAVEAFAARGNVTVVRAGESFWAIDMLAWRENRGIDATDVPDQRRITLLGQEFLVTDQSPPRPVLDTLGYRVADIFSNALEPIRVMCLGDHDGLLCAVAHLAGVGKIEEITTLADGSSDVKHANLRVDWPCIVGHTASLIDAASMEKHPRYDLLLVDQSATDQAVLEAWLPFLRTGAKVVGWVGTEESYANLVAITSVFGDPAMEDVENCSVYMWTRAGIGKARDAKHALDNAATA